MTPREAGWSAHVAGVERSSLVLACGVMAALTPLWGLADLAIEPEFARSFALLRVGSTALTLIALAYAVRGTHQTIRRGLVVAAAVGLGAAVAWMVSQVDDHVAEYTLGFSLVFWGAGIIARWPPSYAAAILTALFGLHLALSHETTFRSLAAQAGWDLYLASVAIISTGVNALWRRLERQAFDARFDLATRNDELNATLAKLDDAHARLVAQERLTALGRLVAQLSHEINNPLNVVQNNLGPVSEHAECLIRVTTAAQLVPGEPGDRLRALCVANDIEFVQQDIHEAIGAMSVATARIADINRNLATFLRADAPAFAVADLNVAVRSAATTWRRNLPARVALTETYGDLPPLPLIPGQVSQLVLNLLANAIDAIGETGHIAIATARDGDFAVLSVSDDGTGISEDARSHLFEPFFTTKDVGKGAGLGLATCYQIAAQHGGTIALDGTYAPGTRIVARLPLAGPPG